MISALKAWRHYRSSLYSRSSVSTGLPSIEVEIGETFSCVMCICLVTGLTAKNCRDKTIPDSQNTMLNNTDQPPSPPHIWYDGTSREEKTEIHNVIYLTLWNINMEIFSWELRRSYSCFQIECVDIEYKERICNNASSELNWILKWG